MTWRINNRFVNSHPLASDYGTDVPSEISPSSTVRCLRTNCEDTNNDRSSTPDSGSISLMQHQYIFLADLVVWRTCAATAAGDERSKNGG